MKKHVYSLQLVLTTGFERRPHSFQIYHTTILVVYRHRMAESKQIKHFISAGNPPFCDLDVNSFWNMLNINHCWP